MFCDDSSSSMSSLSGGVGAREGTVDGAMDDEGVEFDVGTAVLFAAREVVGLDLRGFAIVCRCEWRMYMFKRWE